MDPESQERGPSGIVLVGPSDPSPEAVEVGALLPGTGDEADAGLSPEQLDSLAQDIQFTLSAYDRAMADRLRRWQDIDNAYGLRSNPTRQGTKPDAQRLVSELTRSHVNIASSRITEGVMGMPPLVQVDVIDSQEPDPETTALVDTAKQIGQFFDAYAERGLEMGQWFPLGANRLCRQGDAVLRAMWDVERCPYTYRTANGQIETETRDKGGIHVTLVPNENAVVWPLDQTDIRKMAVAGHRTYLQAPDFRALCRRLKLDDETVEEYVSHARTQGSTGARENEDQRLKNQDVDSASARPAGEICVTELWGEWVVKDEEEPQRLQVFYLDDRQKILRAYKNTLHYGRRHPYFHLPYWREDGSFWGFGVGHELMFNQAKADALLNLGIDNLKVIGNYVRILAAGSGAATQQDQIGPGSTIITDDPANDFRLEALGGDLSHIYQAEDRNDMAATRSTGITPPLQGMGDPVLKSGASPSSLQQLIEQAGKKFGEVDRNIRGGLSDFFLFCLELLQQFSPGEFFYEWASEESAASLQRIKFAVPNGDIYRRFRIFARSPSAASNREMLKLQLQMAHQMAMAHLQVVAQVGQQVMSDNPEGFRRLVEESFRLVHAIFASSVELLDVPGLGGKVPQIPDPTPADVRINELMAQLAQAQQQLQEMFAALQQAQGMPPGQEGMPDGSAAPLQ